MTLIAVVTVIAVEILIFTLVKQQGLCQIASCTTCRSPERETIFTLRSIATGSLNIVVSACE
jgi:hypothetical protein